MKLLRLYGVMLGLILCSVNAMALTTGQVSIFSEPREPLRAVLAINRLDNLPYQKIKVTTPSRAALRKMGLESGQMERLNFKVLPGRKGSALVYIHSAKPLPELAAIALDIRWPGGHKAEGFLLNLEKTKQYYPKLYKRLQLSQAAKMTFYGPIRSYDTLWKVAERIRPSKKLTVQQMMVALLEQNPRAFVAGNMNELQRGQVLLVPPKPAIANISKKAAYLAVRQQIRAWQKNKARTFPVQENAKPSSQIVHLVPGDLPAIDTDDSLVIMQELAVQMQNLQNAMNKMQQDNEKLQMQLLNFEAQMGHLTLKIEQQSQALLTQSRSMAVVESQSVPQFSVEEAGAVTTALNAVTTENKTKNATTGTAYAQTIQPTTGSVAVKPLWQHALESITYWGVALVVLMFLGLFWLGWRLRREHMRRLEDQAVLRATIERMQHSDLRKVANRS